MPKLQVNDDGTVTFPLKKGRSVTLEEPSLDELAWMSMEARRVDDSLPDIPVIDVQAASAEEVSTFEKANTERVNAIFGEGTPYGLVILEVVNKLKVEDTEVTSEDLFGWAASPRTLRTILEHFRSPLPGPAFPNGQTT